MLLIQGPFIFSVKFSYKQYWMDGNAFFSLKQTGFTPHMLVGFIKGEDEMLALPLSNWLCWDN